MDSVGCIKWLNKFSAYHNDLLQDEVRRLQKLHPHAELTYADYYGAFINILAEPDRFGFDEEELLVACCGGGGPFNYNSSAECGNEGSSVCEDPSKYIQWDGKHLTEAAYNVIARGLLDGSFAIFNTCPAINKLDADV